STERRSRDSIKYWTAFYHKRDSLQNIIHPVDSILPFGPKPLGQLVKNNEKAIDFKILKDKPLTNEGFIKNRKMIYETWMYYLWFHPYADADLGENYVEKLLPAFKTYHYIKLNEKDNIEREL